MGLMMVSESRWRIDRVVHIYNSTYSLDHLDLHGQRTTPALQPLVYLQSIFFDFPSGCPNPCCTEDCEMICFPGHGLDSVATDTDPPFTTCAHARCAIGSTAMLCFLDAPPGGAVVGEQRQRWHLQQQCCCHYHLSAPTLEGACNCRSSHMPPTAICP